MPTMVIGRRQGDRVRRLLRKIALGIGVLLLTLVLSYTAFRRWTLITPPADEGEQLPRKVDVELLEGVPRLRVHKSWMERRDGIWRLDLVGDPRTMGFSHGLLSSRVTTDIDRHMVGLMGRYVTTPFRRWLVSNLVRWQFRHIPDHIPPRLLVELAASSRTMVDSEEFPERPFQRLIYYHALHDMTQRLDGSPLIGCSAFAVWGKAAVDGHMIIGRNFDFEGGAIFDQQKAVITFRPAGRIPFVSVAWPGMAGVVTGVNARSIYVSINAARSDASMSPGIPMAFLVREILEQAGSIGEAISIIKKARVMVPEALLIADGKAAQAVVVELAPDKVAIRRTPSGVLGVTNHFTSAKFKADANNDWLRRYTSSDARYKRLMQLLSRFSGRIDIRTAVMILRNRTGVDDEPLGLGNRNALDALIATHSVVVDLSAMVLWVSQGPHILGRFVPIDLKTIFGLPTQDLAKVKAIKADPLVGTLVLDRFLQARAQVKHARRLLSAGDLSAALDFAARASVMAPRMTEPHKLRGDVLWLLGQQEQARLHYRTFLKLHPPYLKDREVVKARIEGQ